MTLTTGRPRTGRDTLSPAQQAILALLVGHQKRYVYVADLLGIDFDDLRERAHGAVCQLVGWEPTDEFGERLIDNALGQLPAGESDAVAVHLRHHAADRSIDARIAAALDGVASRPLQPSATRKPGAMAPVERVATAAVRRVAPAPLRVDSRRSVWMRRAPRSAPVSRVLTLLSLGLSSITAGGVLILNGLH